MKATCHHCNGHGGHFGLAPHWHLPILGQTRIKPDKYWPKNFTEIEKGEGVYTCTNCEGTGLVELCDCRYYYFDDDHRQCVKCGVRQEWWAADNDWVEVPYNERGFV